MSNGITGQIRVPVQVKIGSIRGWGKRRSVSVTTQLQDGKPDTTWARPGDLINLGIKLDLE